MEVSTQQTGFGCYGSYDSRPSFSGHYNEDKYNDHEMGYECNSTNPSAEEDNYDETSISQSESSYSGDFLDQMEIDLDESKDIDQQDVYALAASTEMLRIRFPYQSITVRLSDFCCLQEKDILNDTIVDFCLNHIVEHTLPDDPSRRVTVLPSVFWHNLSLLNAASQDPEIQSLPTEQLLDVRFKDVADFAAGFDLQEVDYIVIPINEWDHWSLAIVCHPFTPQGRIVCFDSQLTADLNNIQNISCLIDDFFKYAWQKWRKMECKYSLPTVIPMNLAQQTNIFDCGVFILEFAKRFLLNPPENLDAFDFSAEYKDFSILSSRQEMQQAVLCLCPNRSIWEPVIPLLNRQD